MPVTLGTYRFTLHYETVESNGPTIGWFRIATSINGENTVIAETEIKAGSTSATTENVTFTDPSELFEHGVYSASGAKIKLKYIEIETVDPHD